MISSGIEQSIVWLHLSDLHNCKAKTGWDAHRVLGPLMKDLKRMEEDHGLTPQLLFFTGDAAFGNIGNFAESTLNEQFDGAHELIETARKAFSAPMPKENVFVVPGNHDVDRHEVTPDQTSWLGTQSQATTVNELIQRGSKQWQRFMDRLAAYREFLIRHEYNHLLSDPARLIFSQVRELRGIKLGIAGFNSAWSCGGDGEKGKLWFGGDWQSGQLLGKLGNADFSVALIHHPFGWFVEQEDPRLRILFERDFAFHLHGHEHLGWVDVKADGHVRVAAGACYDKSDLENGYNFVRLDLDKREGEVWLRKYDAQGGGWVPRVVAGRTTNDGLWRVGKLRWPAKLDDKVSTGSAESERRPVARSLTLDAGESPPNIKSLVTSLLPADVAEMFTYSEFAAWTADDVAGLSLISAVIEHKAEKDIRVIGRGSQLIEARTRPYVNAVAKAILRGVSYTRILYIDPALPQNALLWLLFLERFLGNPKWRDSVHLYKKDLKETNLTQQFQVVDNEFLHHVFRYYSDIDVGASQRAQSSFALSPNGEVAQYSSVYQDHLRNAGRRYRHKDVFDLLTTMLHNLDPQKHSIAYHWQLALDVVAFLESVNVPDLPASRIKFVGCLMPFTFTYDAAEKFASRVNEQSQEERVIALPFRRMDDAIGQFLAKRLSYICLPVENSRVDNLIPPTANEALLASLRNDSYKVYEVELPVSFVLAGIYGKPANWRKLAAVDAAYVQVSHRLPKSAAKLTRGDEEVESNYHAAWLARRDPAAIAITTPQAATYFELHVYSGLCDISKRNNTKFGVYSHQKCDF